MMTDKSNCSQLQVIFQEQLHGHAFPRHTQPPLVEIFTLFDVKIIQIWTFPADPSTERVPSLAERVAYLRHPINLRLFNWRVPALLYTPWCYTKVCGLYVYIISRICFFAPIQRYAVYRLRV